MNLRMWFNATTQTNKTYKEGTEAEVECNVNPNTRTLQSVTMQTKKDKREISRDSHRPYSPWT